MIVLVVTCRKEREEVREAGLSWQIGMGHQAHYRLIGSAMVEVRWMISQIGYLTHSHSSSTKVSFKFSVDSLSVRLSGFEAIVAIDSLRGGLFLQGLWIVLDLPHQHHQSRMCMKYCQAQPEPPQHWLVPMRDRRAASVLRICLRRDDMNVDQDKLLNRSASALRSATKAREFDRK